MNQFDLLMLGLLATFPLSVVAVRVCRSLLT